MKQETPKQNVELINDNIDEFDEKIKEFKQIDQTNPVTRGSTALVKQETLEEETKCYCGHTTTCDCGPEEAKQECMITKIMKNIHILPTDKPSRLYEDVDNDLQLGYDFTIRQGMLQNQNIYITNDEEIRVGDWYINTFVSEREQKPQTHTEKKQLINNQKDYRFKYCKKIILTTDQDLDGVQVIDDEFLEWFVKNPSCEEIEVESNYKVKSGTIQEHNEGKAGYEYYDYKIIIPKEELKSFSDFSDKFFGSIPKEEILLEEVFNDEKKENIKKFIDEISNPSQPNQALKDAAERLKGKELFKESNDRARKILSEIKSLPIQETLSGFEDMRNKKENDSDNEDNEDNVTIGYIYK